MGSIRKTLSDSTGTTALQYLGAFACGEESNEIIEYHSQLLVAQLAAITELDAWRQSFPWKVVACFDATACGKVLLEMKEVWAFCTQYVDGLGNNHRLFDMLGFTRWQPFRDVMVKGE